MKIPEFGSLEMVRTNPAHFGTSKIIPMTHSVYSSERVDAVEKVDRNSGFKLDRINNAARTNQEEKRATFQDFLISAVNSMNQKQLDVSSLQEKLITSPDEVDIHDVTIAMSKAQTSLNIAQTVIDRIVQGWSEITTTR